MPAEAPVCTTVAALCKNGVPKEFTRTFGCHLHFNGPGDTGFGVKRVTMLLPECAMLMVSPCGCGRSGTVVGQQNNFEERVFYYKMSDRDVVTGAYLNDLPAACTRIREQLHPRAILICMTCIDALMGTDLDGLCRRLTGQVGLPVTGCFMDPTVRETHRAPLVQVQQAIYRCLQPRPTVPGQINLLGQFAPLPSGCELFSLLQLAGISQAGQLSACKSYNDFLAMAQASYNLVTDYHAEAAASELQKRLGIPYISLPLTYGTDRTAASYAHLAEFLQHDLHTNAMQQQAQQRLLDFAAARRGLRVAIGEAVIGSPLELAETLLEAGIAVPFVFRNLLVPGDSAVLERLVRLAPELKIYSGVHPSTRRFADALPQADIAIGLDAGYFLPEAVSIAWSGNEAHFGFEALIALLARMTECLADPQAHRAQMHGSYLTV